MRNCLKMVSILKIMCLCTCTCIYPAQSAKIFSKSRKLFCFIIYGMLWKMYAWYLSSLFFWKYLNIYTTVIFLRSILEHFLEKMSPEAVSLAPLVILPTQRWDLLPHCDCRRAPLRLKGLPELAQVSFVLVWKSLAEIALFFPCCLPHDLFIEHNYILSQPWRRQKARKIMLALHNGTRFKGLQEYEQWLR